MFKLKGAGKLHMFLYIGMSICSIFMAVNDSQQKRFIYLILILILQQATLLAFMVDYDSISQVMWKQKEKDLIDSKDTCPSS